MHSFSLPSQSYPDPLCPASPTRLRFSQAAGPSRSLPARHHLTAVFKRSCQKLGRGEGRVSVCVCLCTFASMILVFATSRGVVTNAATAPKRDTDIFNRVQTRKKRPFSALKYPLNILNKHIHKANPFKWGHDSTTAPSERFYLGQSSNVTVSTLSTRVI